MVCDTCEEFKGDDAQRPHVGACGGAAGGVELDVLLALLDGMCDFWSRVTVRKARDGASPFLHTRRVLEIYKLPTGIRGMPHKARRR